MSTNPTVLRYTTAPEAYDGFLTETIAVVGTYCGKPLRCIRVQVQHLTWQESRNGSGMHPTYTPEEYQAIQTTRDFVPEKA